MTLYNPKNIESSPTVRLLQHINSIYAVNLQSYYDLFIWSITYFDAFWSLVWDETHVIGEKGSHTVDNNALPSQNPPWYGSVSIVIEILLTFIGFPMHE